jgi:sugar phosphate isomerase/epimerase
VYVACSTLCFGSHPLDEALRTIRDLHFAKADLAVNEHGPHLKPSEMTGDIGRIAQKLKAVNLPVAAFRVEFAAPDGDDTRKQLRGVCRLARVLTVPLLSVAAAPKGSDFTAEVGRLQEWVKLAEAEGVILTVETDRDTLTADPMAAVELCRRVPGLGITLDPSHYLAGPDGPANYDPLYPYVRHVRLRDTGKKPEAFQVRIGQGDVEYGRIIAQLDRFRYDRALTVDVRDTPTAGFPVEPEVRKLKYLLESLV